MAQEFTDLRTLSHAQLEELVSQTGQPAFRVKQLEEWMWVRGARDFTEMTNLPKALRETLAQSWDLGVAEELVKQVSRDGSRKYLLGLRDGSSVECVGMPSGNRLSVCISTQVGCGMKCAFCATGMQGLTRSLSAEEMFDQVMHVARDFGTPVTSVVFMGQGEPFANYEQTLKTLRRLNNPVGPGIGARHLTVSTCGVIPSIRKFSNEPEQFTLALSLHSAVQRTRNELMPGVKKYSLVRLYDAMGEYVKKTGRRPSYEFIMIDGVNDSNEELQALVDFCRGTLCHVNLIQLNEVPGSRFRPVDPKRVNDFVGRLRAAGVETTVRESRGSDIDAACGQLRRTARA